MRIYQYLNVKKSNFWFKSYVLFVYLFKVEDGDKANGHSIAVGPYEVQENAEWKFFSMFLRYGYFCLRSVD